MTPNGAPRASGRLVDGAVMGDTSTRSGQLVDPETRPGSQSAQDGGVAAMSSSPFPDSSSRSRSSSKSQPQSNSSLNLRRTSTRDSHASSTGEGGGPGAAAANLAASIISGTKTFFKKQANRRGSIASEDPASPTTAPSPLEQSSSATNEMHASSSSTGAVSDTRRSPAPTSIELPAPLVPHQAPRYTSGPGSNLSVQSGATASTSASSVPTVSTAATTVDGNSSPRSSSNIGLGAAPMTTEARLKALPRLSSYTVAPTSVREEDHEGDEGALGRIDSRDSEAGGDTHDEYTTTSTETENDDEGDDDDGSEEDEDDREHDEDDVRGGVAAMRTSLQRPALPTLASTRGFSRTATTPGANQSPVTSTGTSSSNPFSFSGWTTFASSTPTPGPLRTARPQPGDNAPFGSYFDPRPSSSRPGTANTVFRTPAQTPGATTENGAQGHATSPQQQQQQQNIPTTPGSAAKGKQPAVIPPMPSSSISPPASRIRADGRPGSASKRQSSGFFPHGVTAGGPAGPRSMSGQSSAMSTAAASPGSGVSVISGGVLKNAGSPLARNPNSRPGFYHRASRSLVDLSRSLESETDVVPIGQASTSSFTIDKIGSAPGAVAQDVPSGSSASASASPPTPSTSQEPGTDSQATTDAPQLGVPVTATIAATSPGASSGHVHPHAREHSNTVSVVRSEPASKPLQRRMSMPEMRVDPPLYQLDDDDFVQYRDDQPLPSAREDEGREALPDYSCDVHIEGFVPRKMEFTKPGVQAKDRRWKRQYVILHGTSIKVYKSDPRQKAPPGEEAPPTPGIHTDKHRPSFGSGYSKNSNGSNTMQSGSVRVRAPTQSSISSTSSMESEKALLYNRAVQEAFAKRKFDPDMPVHVHLQDEDEHGLASLQHAPSTLLAKASENRCIRHYTLQGAESGLAADYLKRRHVVRIRAEGEQFLLQCKDDRAVIDWIEALQAATNTALDLDVRPLPKFITLPRRRRRRRVADPANPNSATTAAPNAGTTGLTGANGAATGAAAGARSDSPANANGQQVTARSEAMNAMLAEEQDNILAGRS